MKDRVLKVRKEAGLNQEDFAKKINLTKNYISLIETGNRVPSDRTISDICRELHVNEEWLRNETPPMYKEAKKKLETYLGQISKGNDDFIEDLIEVYMELDTTSKEALRTLAKKMADKLNERGQ